MNSEQPSPFEGDLRNFSHTHSSPALLVDLKRSGKVFVARTPNGELLAVDKDQRTQLPPGSWVEQIEDGAGLQNPEAVKLVSGQERRRNERKNF